MLGTLRFILDHPLNRGHAARAIGRYLRWQVGARLLPVPHVMPFVDDTVLVMERGMTGATGNWYCGLHEFADMGFVLHFLRPDDLFVDIGANVGSYTVLGAGVVGARTVSFEPVPDTFRKLERNIAANGLTGIVDAHNIGLSGREETLRFTAGRDTVNHVVSGATTEATVEVPVKRLDDVLAGAVPRLIKLDVEGWESEVLDGMPVTLTRPELSVIITETNQSAGRYGGSGEDRVAETMRAHGFAAYSYDPFQRKLVAGGSSYNTIFARDIDFVRNRLAQASPRRVLGRTI